MYENFYGLKKKPFGIVADPEYLYLSDAHAKALTYLEYGISETAGFILLTGEIGAGKTTLVRHMLNRIGGDLEVAEVFNTNVAPDQLLGMIANEFGLEPNGDKSGNLDLLNRYLIERYAAGKQVLLVIDEAQNLCRAAIEEVRMLSNLQVANQLLLQILLVGQPELKYRLMTPAMSQLAQRVAVSFHLGALEKNDIGNYIAHRLEKAGGGRDIFTAAAVDLIFRASGGIPRTINLLCDAALVYGYADGLKTIDAALIASIIEEKGGIGMAVGCDYKTQACLENEAQGPQNEPDARIADIEQALRVLETRLSAQIQALENRADAFRAETQQVVNLLLQEQRERSDVLLQKFDQISRAHVMLLEKFGLQPDRPSCDGRDGTRPAKDGNGGL